MHNKTNPQQKAENHTITIQNQSNAHITGVSEVITATESGILCKLLSNNLQIIGENLRISKLLPEERLLIIDGYISNIKYSSSNQKTSFLKKIFR